LRRNTRNLGPRRLLDLLIKQKFSASFVVVRLRSVLIAFTRVVTERRRFGIVGRALGASFAVLIAEQLFASGCELLGWVQTDPLRCVVSMVHRAHLLFDRL
jgi:hypothetical protein